MHLFKNNSIDKIFDFKLEDTSFIKDVNIMSSRTLLAFFEGHG